MDKRSPVLGTVIYWKLLVMGLGLQGRVNYHRECVQLLVSVQLPLESCGEDVFFPSVEDWLSNLFRPCSADFDIQLFLLPILSIQVHC